RQPGIEAQDAVADIGTRVAALHEVERPRHDTHVDAFLRRAALNVLGIAAQRDQEPLPRALRVDSGEDPGMGDETQRRAVRRAPVVVRDVPRYRVETVAVPEPPENLA